MTTPHLNNPLTNGEPDAVLTVTQNWNPGGGRGVYNDHPIGVLYDADIRKWAICNRGGAPMEPPLILLCQEYRIRKQATLRTTHRSATS